MSKQGRIQELARQFEGQGIDPRYAGYFALFNGQKFYEAHDVLEGLWLLDRQGADGDFYKGLIQLAGAFVHLQKNRPQPAGALLRLARANLEKYPASHCRLDVAAVLKLVELWLRRLETGGLAANPPAIFPPPAITLSPEPVQKANAPEV